MLSRFEPVHSLLQKRFGERAAACSHSMENKKCLDISRQIADALSGFLTHNFTC
jgi:hypothetical protein